MKVCCQSAVVVQVKIQVPVIADANTEFTTGMWLLIDKIIQQVVLQKSSQDYDYATLEINVKKTILMYVSYVTDYYS